MSILLIGADGQLGTDLKKVLDPSKVIPLTISDLDITKEEQIVGVLEKYKPAVVINTAAFNDTFACEDDPAQAFAVNAAAVKDLAKACKENGSVLVHISTDYVFDGKKGSPYTEEDPPNPLSVYAASKLAGEVSIRAILHKYFIVRTSGLYGVAGALGKGRTNFVENMLKKSKQGDELQVVEDEVLTPTYALDLAAKIAELLKTTHYGLYHVTNNGQCSWYEFTKKILALCGISVSVKAVLAKERQSKIRRPGYSVLENKHLKQLGLDDLRPWPKALEAYLKEKGHI